MCPSICPCLSTWLPLDDLLYNLIFESSLKSCWENLNFLMRKCNTSLQSLGGQNIKESQLCWTPKWTWVVGLTSCPIFFRERALITHQTEGWVGPRADLEILEKRKISCPGLSTPQPSQYSDYAIAPDSRNLHPDHLHMKMLPFFI